jgi:hypothetical protein
LVVMIGVFIEKLTSDYIVFLIFNCSSQLNQPDH